MNATSPVESTRPTTLLGRHYLAEMTGCAPARIATVDGIEQMFLDAIASSGATILSYTSHQFSPAGATIVVLLAESHASLHTWPERGAVCLDFFTCSESIDIPLALGQIKDALGAARMTVRSIDREVPP